MSDFESESSRIKDDPISDAPQELSETWATGLEGQALEIVSSDAVRQCIQAGPGTGKSFCTTRRLLRLIERKIVKPGNVLAVTFTRTAATDLRRSLDSNLPEKYRGYRACTLHSLCYDIVRSEDYAQVRDRYPRFLLTASKSSNLGFEGAPLLADLKAVHGTPTQQSRKIRDYEAMWAKHQHDPLGSPSKDEDAKYQADLLAWLTFHRGMLVGELLPLTYEYLSGEPDSRWRTQYKAILVDEYQDLNKVDQEVIDLLGSDKSCQISVVGDLDQSIYSFRHAHPDGLTEYSRRPDVEPLTMKVSRRCPKRHLAAAQTLIKQNVNHASEYPVPLPNAKAGEVFVRRWKDLQQQVKGAVAFVEFCIAQGVPAGDILIMTPCRPIGQEIRKALLKVDVEAQSYFSEELMEEFEAQQAFTLLALLVNKHDRVALRTWLGGWKDHQEAVSYKLLREYCENARREPWDALEDVIAGRITIGKIDRLMSRFQGLATRLTPLGNAKGDVVLDALFPEGADWSDDIRAAIGIPVHEDTTPQDLLDRILEAVTQPTMPEDVSHVRIMSLHKAKGLTASASAIVGAMEGLAPRHWNDEKDELSQAEHLEEQRRLFYVAMTRSTDYLLIASCLEVPSTFAYTYALRGTPQGGSFYTKVSRFVSSLGEITPESMNSLNFTVTVGNNP